MKHFHPGQIVFIEFSSSLSPALKRDILINYSPVGSGINSSKEPWDEFLASALFPALSLTLHHLFQPPGSRFTPF